MLHIYLIGTCSKSMIQQKTDRDITQKDIRLSCMNMMYPSTGWSKTVEVPFSDLGEAAMVKTEYMDKS